MGTILCLPILLGTAGGGTVGGGKGASKDLCDTLDTGLSVLMTGAGVLGRNSSLGGLGGRLGSVPRGRLGVVGGDRKLGANSGRLGAVEARGRPISRRLFFPLGAAGGGVLGGGDEGGARWDMWTG